MNVLVVIATVVAGGLGALLRFLVSLAFNTPNKARSFPWSVLIVNALGSALGGVALGLTERISLSGDWQLVILTGICGGLTTFSTFSVETVQLIESKRYSAAASSVLLNLVVGFVACFGLYLLVR